MFDLDDVRSFLSEEHGLAVVSTVQSDGRVLSSVVNAGVANHPTTGEPALGFVSAGSAARLAHIRRGSEVSLTVRRGWRWVSVTGPAMIVGPDEPGDLDADSISSLLRDVFSAAGGTHENWDEYDRVMRADRRAAVFVDPVRILGNG
ncbi:MAG: pyridoxamine 5'-phosphate oxidase [Ilumatobacter sp.]|nr:pyridoxamine 5'-phosphate oxidase [Ilumatobacter sp.]